MEKFKNGQIVYSIGLDMNCKKVICKSKFIEYQDANEHGQDCVIDVGFLMISKSNTIFATKKEVNIN